MIDYDHAQNVHTVSGAAAALAAVFSAGVPNSLLDVGCGTGTWLRAAIDLGVVKAIGIDGIVVPDHLLTVPREAIRLIDLTLPFDLGRRFDMAVCLEVAEHLPEACASQFVADIAAHTDLVLFSAACPGQPGQHHINCQWPSYWQGLFNRNGFACDDSIRWKIWDNSRIEPWYRQNMFWARRDPSLAGQEPRLRPVIHPDFVEGMSRPFVAEARHRIESGAEAPTWYLTTLVQAAAAKFSRRLFGKIY
jgi:SAM-dependent methyltransferase